MKALEKPPSYYPTKAQKEASKGFLFWDPYSEMWVDFVKYTFAWGKSGDRILKWDQRWEEVGRGLVQRELFS